MKRVSHRPIPGEERLTAPAALSARYPAPSLTLDPRVRAVLETPRLGCEPGTSSVVIDELKAADAPFRDPFRYDPFRYDPNRLLPSSARVRQVRIERLPLRPCMSDVAELLERIDALTGAGR